MRGRSRRRGRRRRDRGAVRRRRLGAPTRIFIERQPAAAPVVLLPRRRIWPWVGAAAVGLCLGLGCCFLTLTLPVLYMSTGDVGQQARTPRPGAESPAQAGRPALSGVRLGAALQRQGPDRLEGRPQATALDGGGRHPGRPRRQVRPAYQRTQRLHRLQTRAECRINAEGDSGIFVRHQLQQGKEGYEAQIGCKQNPWVRPPEPRGRKACSARRPNCSRNPTNGSPWRSRPVAIG